MSVSYPSVVIPYAAYHIFSNNKSEDRDRLLVDAWEMPNRQLMLEAKRNCVQAKVNLWSAMHYAGSSSSSGSSSYSQSKKKESMRLTLAATWREQVKLGLDTCKLEPVFLKAMQAWLLVETNREALKAFEKEKKDNKQVFFQT